MSSFQKYRPVETFVVVTQSSRMYFTSFSSFVLFSRPIPRCVVGKCVCFFLYNCSAAADYGLPSQMFELWAVRVHDDDGKEIYGDLYSDIWAIHRLHFIGASSKSCDHVSYRHFW